MGIARNTLDLFEKLNFSNIPYYLSTKNLQKTVFKLNFTCVRTVLPNILLDIFCFFMVKNCDKLLEMEEEK